MAIRLFFLITIAIVSCRCTEKYDIEFADSNPKLVVEGIVTNKPGPNYVRLTLSKTTFSDQSNNDTIHENWYLDGVTSVTDALVVISDNNGNIENLTKSPDYVWYYNYNENGNLLDSSRYLNYYGNYRGYYQTNTMVGTPGNTYYLNINWNGNQYTASCYMPPIPPVDSVTYDYTIASTGKENYYIPYIWFNDNQSTNDYYLFCTQGGDIVWPRSVLSDRNITSGIVGLNVFQGETTAYWRNGYPTAGCKYTITMNSITKEIYNYYSALIAQFRNDGGVYTPTPASPPTNISNGGLGYFRASAVNEITDTMPYTALTPN